MAWVRNVEKLSASRDGANYYEYEFASECRIPGVLDYEEGKITCGGLSFEKDNNGLYHYLLRVQYPKFEGGWNEAADKRGYCFKQGVIGEILSLLSLYFQCRFYLVATYFGELTKKSLKIKTENDFLYRKVNKELHPKIFSTSERNFAKGLPNFFNLARKLDSKKHQNFILSCYHYARSLKEVGIDSEMVFIRLVSAIETLSKNHKLNKRDNPLDGEKFSELFAAASLSMKQRKQLMEILKVTKQQKIQIQKSKQRFIGFVNYFSRGCLTGGNWKAKHTKIKRKNFSNVLAAIYDGRSSYLHAGEPMYLSQFLHGARKWDTDPSSGMIIDNRKFSSSQKLPYTYWFENVVRHCLLKYLKSQDDLRSGG